MRLVALAALVCVATALFANEITEEERSRAMLAMSLSDYPVTPGDVYVLTYRIVTEPVVADLIVEQDLSVNLGPFGVVNAAGMTFVELRRRIQDMVVASYPRGVPRLVIRSIGRFQVTFAGEVDRAALVRVDGLTRIASVVTARATEYASLRNVVINRRDGSRLTVDLFRFERDGDLSHNPYFRPDDRVELSRAERTVRLSGDVRRPGTYQLLPGENLQRLIERYGDGATASADLERLRIVRVPPDPRGTSIAIDVNLLDGETELRDGDAVSVRTKDAFLPVVFFEGAVLRRDPTPEDDDEIFEQVEYARFSYRFRPGDTLADAARSLSRRFLPAADLSEAFLRRAADEEGTRIPVDVERLLYERDPVGDVDLEPGDRIVIPFQEQFIVLDGEVQRAGMMRVDGLTRLASVVTARATEFASLREIVVHRRDGTRELYDLFLYNRDGDLSQNPYLRPYDRVELSRAERTVRLSGDVRRPGTYQLLPGENLLQLIERYGDGATASADLERLRIVRVPPDPRDTSIAIDVNLLDGETELRDGDAVSVRTKDAFLPVVFFEGAVFDPDDDIPDGPSTQGVFSRFSYRFRPGTLLSDAVRATSGRLLPSADLPNAYVVRTVAAGGGIVPVNLENLLFSRDPDVDLALEPGDRVFVPFRQHFVIVSGAVQGGGRIPFVPGRTYEYYLAQSGGADRNRHFGNAPVIRSVDGERRSRSDEIQPEDRIHFPTNNPLFYVGPVATVVSTTVSLILLIVNLAN